MNRTRRLLEHVDIHAGDGLEIGALDSPVVPPQHPGISYVDHLDTPGLRQKYAQDPHVDVGRIVAVRYVWDGSSLAELVGARRFAYVIGSHVAEHVPDLIGWLQQVRQVLAPGGVLALVVPDQRYTFDCQRRLTTIAELVEAHFLEYRRPSIRQVLDHFVHKVDVPEQCTIAQLWEDPARAAQVPRSHPQLLWELGATGLRKHFDAIQRGEYIDSHCSVFTPASFVELLSQMAALDMCGFTVKHLSPTLPGEQDFLVLLERLPEAIAASPDPALRRQFVLERLPVVL